MSFNRVLGPLVVLTLLASTTILSLAQDSNDSIGVEMQQLKSQRVEVLRELFHRYEHAYKQGKVSIETYLSRKETLLDAELELAKNSAHRVALRRSHLSSLRQHEQLIRTGVQAGKFAEIDVFHAKADRIDAEIALLREQQ